MPRFSAAFIGLHLASSSVSGAEDGGRTANDTLRQNKMLAKDEPDAWPVDNELQDETMRPPTRQEVEEGLEMLESLVHPEDELQDEEDDRRIFQAVVTSMAQWNLRKIQKLKESMSNTTKYLAFHHLVHFDCERH